MRAFPAAALTLLFVFGVLPVGVRPAVAQSPGKVDFNFDIKPLLSDRCFKCHGPDAEHREADLRLDTKEGAFGLSAEDTPILKAGDAAASELFRRIASNDPDVQMPPPDSKLSLTKEEVDLVRRWIEQGAEWKQHWSFLSLNRIPVARTKNLTWPKNEIDHFVLAHLEEAGLKPAKPATKEKWLRRVTFDLTGLPPTIEEIDAFLADNTGKAYERVVDRLLDSERFGERMAADWLDVARYSDTYGYQVDRDRFVWPWRDWVIRAFNSNMSYDKFITQQIAGDLLPDASDSQILATTFNRLHPQKVEGGSVPEEFRVEYVADRTQTMGTAFLGLTLECCRCHDHKYDPISTKEYYQLFAYFDKIDEAGLYSYFTPSVPTPTLRLTDEAKEKQIVEARRKVLEKTRAAQIDKKWYDHQNFFEKEDFLPPEEGESPGNLLPWDFVPRYLGGRRQSQGFREDLLRSRVSCATNAPLQDRNVRINLNSVDESSWLQELRQHAKSFATAKDKQAPLIPGRVAHLHFEDHKGGANKSVTGKIGKAVKLSGDDGIGLKVGNFSRWQPFSVSLWMKTPDHQERAVVFHRSRAWTDAGSRGYELLIEDGRLSFALIHFDPGNSIRVRTKNAIPVDAWIHVTVTYDGSSRASGVRLFLGGRAAAQQTVRDSLYKNITGGGGDNITIGQRFRDRGFAGGLVDEFQVFDRQLCCLEVAHLVDGKSLTEALHLSLTNLQENKPVAGLKGEELVAEVARQDRIAATRANLLDYYRRVVSKEWQKRRHELREARAAYFKLQDGLQEIMVMRDLETKQLGVSPRQTYLLGRGNYTNRKDPVNPLTPAVFPGLPKDAPKNRLGLAKWLTDPKNPLTARVAVNRFWQMCFGEGLVRTPEDFGSQGALPTHPQLLDWLAGAFIAEDWDVKWLLKQMVLSSTYRQSSIMRSDTSPTEILKGEKSQLIDPENRLLGRSSAYRLPAEMLRDNALAVSGLLRNKIGGPPAKPYEVAVSFKPVGRDKGEGLYRRSVYTYWKRTGPAPVMRTLDASKRDVCRVKRERTSSPLQALVLLNGPQFVEASRALAQKLIQKHGEDSKAALVEMFRLLTSRRPEGDELKVLTDFLALSQKTFEENPKSAQELLKVGDIAADPKIPPAKLAAMTIVANTMLSYDECVMKR